MPDSIPPDFPALLARYERPLVRYAFGILGDLEGARDVVQDTFIRLVRSEMAIAGGKHLEAWLFTVCRHRAVDYQRKHSRIIPMTIPDEAQLAAEPDPAEQTERSDTAASLLRLLKTLPANQQEVIRLKFQNDLSYKEIAEITKLSVTNVGFLMHTGLKRVRALLQASPGDEWAAMPAPGQGN